MRALLQRFAVWDGAPPLVAAVLMAVVVLPWLGEPPLAGAEGHRVMPARAMLESGDFVVPELVGEVYLRKPPGMFWLLAGSQAILGDHGWAWRLPSALSGMLLAAGLAWMGRRWYGLWGGWAAAIGGAALVPLWSQWRAADIDSINTLTSFAAAIALLVLLVGHPRRRWAWSVLLTISLAATLLLKLHAGLSLVGGALIAGTILGGLRAAGRPGVWLGLTGGVGLFLAWVVAVVVRVGDGGDSRGVEEAALNVFRFSRLLGALEAQALLLLYTVPLSLTLVLLPRMLRRPPVTGVMHDRHRLTPALLLTLGIGHALLLINGVSNPRYGYVLLPMWPLLCAAVAAAWRDGVLLDREKRFVEWVLAVTAVALPVAAVVLAVMQLKREGHGLVGVEATLWVAIIGGGAAAVVSLVFWGKRQRLRGIACVALGVGVLALPMSVLQTYKRYERSGREAGQVVASVVPAGTRVLADALVRDKPEVFAYSQGVRGVSRQGLFADPASTSLEVGTWVAMTQAEWRRWNRAMERGESQLLDRVSVLPTRDDRPAILARVGIDRRLRSDRPRVFHHAAAQPLFEETCTCLTW